MGRFNDEIPNINLLDTKVPQIHGHTKIELYNPTTKIKSVTESDNTFQSQVAQKLMSSQGSAQLIYSDTDADSLGKIVPIIFGGLMLFRDTIPVGSQYMPKTNKMVGLGYRDKTNGTYPMSLGSFNAVESSASINGMTMVYDFATNQSNGQIGCVCLTHKQGARCGGYGYPDNDRPLEDGVSMFVAHDDSSPMYDSDTAGYNDATMPVGNITYGFTWSRTNKTITVGKKHHWISQFSLKSGYQEFKTFDVSDDIASVSGINIDTGNRNSCCYLGDGKIIVDCVYHNTYDWNNGARTYYFVYDIANDTITLESMINATGVALSRPSGNKFGGQGVVAVQARNGYNWFLIDRESGVVLHNFNISDSGYSIDHVDNFLDRNIIYHNLPILSAGRSGYGAWFYIKESDTLLPTSVANTSYNSGHYTITDDLIGKRAYQNDWYVDVNPLMLLTINNLNSPVTKTAAQTMKVTYTLTES